MNGSSSDAAPGGRDLSTSAWTEVVPWFMTILSVMVLFSLAWFLVENILWFRKIATAAGSPVDAPYRIYVYQLHLAMVKRSVGLFAGFALIFVGTSVAFYTLKAETSLGANASGAALKLNTTSPGIIAMVLGVALIMFTIYSKDVFPPAPQPSAAEEVHVPPVPPP